MFAILTVGLPASGKTTWAHSQRAYKVLDLDDFREVLGDRHDQSLTREAVALRDQVLNKAIFNMEDVIIADTNLNPIFRAELVDKLLRAGYSVKLKVFDTPFDVCCERNNVRVNPVPKHAMERMHSQMIEQFPG
jgi:predicted kinase